MNRWAFVAAVASLSGSSTAVGAFTRAGDSSVSFTAVGPAGMKIVGNTADLDVSDGPGTVRVTVPLAHLTTGIDLRDRHMREKYLEAAVFPTAVLEVPRAAIDVPPPGSERSGTAAATMTLHGRSHPVIVRYTAKGEANTWTVSGSLTLDMHDYGIQVPSYLGVTVKPGVDIAARFLIRASP